MGIVLAYPPRPKWISYYWECAKHFGEECYRTWKEELSFALIVMFIAYLISRGPDIRAANDLQVALLSSGIGLGIVALWHLIRAPFFAHADAVVGDPNASVPAWYGVFGILILLAMAIGGGKLGMYVYSALPKERVEMIIRPPLPPVLSAQQPLVIQNTIDPKALAAAMAEVEQHQKSESNQSPLATKLLALSKRILGFTLERGRLSPRRTVPKNSDEMNSQWSAQVTFSQETQNQYALNFSAELAALLQEVKATGVDIDNWEWRCGPIYGGSTLSGIQECAAQLGVFADQVR